MAVLGYDDGVYYSAANGLIHGQLPYRDFILVHPPGILVLLSPFALIGRLFGDSNGLIATRIVFMLIGSVTTVLIYYIGKRLSLIAGLFAGLTYAIWYPAIIVERTSYLEAVGLFAIAFSLFLLQKDAVTRRDFFLSGLVLGLATATKLWFAIPLIVIFLWLLLRRKIEGACLLAISSAISFLSICGYFWFKAGTKFLHLVLFAQLNRSTATGSHLGRLQKIFNLEIFNFTSISKSQLLLAVLLTAPVLLLILAKPKEYKYTLIWLSIFIIQLIVILTTPTFFQSYSSFIAPSLALLIGSISYSLSRLFSGKMFIRKIILLSLVIPITLLGWQGINNEIGEGNPPLVFLRDVVTNQKCVAADSPVILVISNSLSRDLNQDCKVIFDVNGTIYGVTEPPGSNLLSATQRRKHSTEYQSELVRYFEDSDLFILKRLSADGLARNSLLSLENKKLIERQNGFTVYLHK